MAAHASNATASDKDEECIITAHVVKRNHGHGARGRMWCFTLPADEAKGEHVKWCLGCTRDPPLHWGEDFPNLVHMMYQVEQAPTTNKIHIQGFCCFKSPQALSTLHAKVPRAHWEKSRGTLADNIAYCSKMDTRICGPFDGTQYINQIDLVGLWEPENSRVNPYIIQ